MKRVSCEWLAGFLSDWRAWRKACQPAAFLPSPLVGEGGRDAEHRGRVRGLSPRIETPHPARFARHLLPQGEKEGRNRFSTPPWPCRGHREGQPACDQQC